MSRRAGVTAESRFFWIRIQIFLDSRGFPDLLIRMSGKPPVSRTCGLACQGNRRLPGTCGLVIKPHFTWSSLQRAEKYLGLRSRRRAALARLRLVFCNAFSMMFFLQAFNSV